MDSHSPIGKQYTILYVDDEAGNLKAFERSFRFDFKVLTALSGAQALTLLREHEVHLILTDQRMPEMTGLEFLQAAMQRNPSAVRMILTAYSDTEVLLKAIQEGKVYDYILKPWRRDAMLQRLHRAVEFYQFQVERIAQLQNRLESAEQQLETLQSWEKLIGAEKGLSALVRQIKKVAPTDATVLIRGESGTGKELIAQAIHQNSSRKDGPLIKVNASAFSEGVLESELFGHEKGAFTGALQSKKGRFELAHQGSLFLDEIGDLSKAVQVKLLRILQEKELERVGGTRTIPVDIRLIAATHRPMELLVESDQFREDLFYRINVVPLKVPPLRERTVDIQDLAHHFLQTFNRQLGKSVRFSQKSLAEMQNYPWPGNVRELKNIVERAVVLADDQDVIEPHDLPLCTTDPVPPQTLPQFESNQPIRETIQEQATQELIAVLKQTRGNLSEAARLLKIPRTTLYSRLKKQSLV